MSVRLPAGWSRRGRLHSAAGGHCFSVCGPRSSELLCGRIEIQRGRCFKPGVLSPPRLRRLLTKLLEERKLALCTGALPPFFVKLAEKVVWFRILRVKLGGLPQIFQRRFRMIASRDRLAHHIVVACRSRVDAYRLLRIRQCFIDA